MKKINTRFLILLLLIQLISQAKCQSNCNSSILVENPNTFFLISDKQATTNEAQESCMKAGGKLPQLSYRMSSTRMKTYIRRNLNFSGLALVSIFRKSGYPNQIKYSSSVFKLSVVGYIVPFEGIRSFYMHYRLTNQTEQNVTFCSSGSSVFIGKSCVPNTSPKFKLYGALKPSNKTITLYSYYSPTYQSTELFLNNHISISKLQKPIFPQGLEQIYIPEISVLTGAQSKLNQDKWFWNNGTFVNDSDFPTSNLTLCQQMTWPLTYDDRINLRPTPCDYSESLYVCEITFKIEVVPVICDGSELVVKWKGVDHINDNIEDLQVEIKVNGKTHMKIPFNTNSVTLNGLFQRTEYKISAIVSTADCKSLLTSSVNATTSFGIPGPVKNSRVLNNNSSSSDCVITWPFISEHTLVPIDYKIYDISTSRMERNVSRLTSDFKSKQFLYIVDLSKYSSNTKIHFEIQAFSCNGGSNITSIAGYCTVPKPTRPNIPIQIITIAILCCLVVILLTVIIVVCKRKQAMPIDESKIPVVSETVHGEPQFSKSSNENQQQHYYNENVSEPSYDYVNDCGKPHYVNVSNNHPGVSNPGIMNESVYEIAEKL